MLKFEMKNLTLEFIIIIIIIILYILKFKINKMKGKENKL
jgi:hypothetical protein